MLHDAIGVWIAIKGKPFMAIQTPIVQHSRPSHPGDSFKKPFRVETAVGYTTFSIVLTGSLWTLGS